MSSFPCHHLAQTASPKKSPKSKYGDKGRTLPMPTSVEELVSIEATLKEGDTIKDALVRETAHENDYADRRTQSIIQERDHFIETLANLSLKEKEVQAVLQRLTYYWLEDKEKILPSQITQYLTAESFSESCTLKLWLETLFFWKENNAWQVDMHKILSVGCKWFKHEYCNVGSRIDFNSIRYLAYVSQEGKICLSTWLPEIGLMNPYIPSSIEIPAEQAELALAIFKNQLHLVYIEQESHKVRFSFSIEGKEWENPYIAQPGFRAKASLNLAAFNDKLHLVYIGNKAGHIWIASSEDGKKWSESSITRVGFRAAKSLSLTTFNNNLYLAYIGKTSGNIFLASSKDGKQWSASQQIKGLNAENVKMVDLATVNSKLYLNYGTNFLFLISTAS